MPIEIENDQERKATKLAQDLLGQVRDIQATLVTMGRQLQVPRLKAKLGDISTEIYQNNYYPQRDNLSTLPAELQHLIWSHLTYPADRLMLALSCKAHAAVFQGLNGNAQKPKSTKRSAKAVDNENNKPKKPIAQKCPTKIERLHVLCRLQSWMPKNLKLCYGCARFRSKTRPKRKIEPASNVGRDEWGGKTIVLTRSGNEKEITKELKEAMEYGARCPECRVQAHLSTVSAKKEHKQLKLALARLI